MNRKIVAVVVAVLLLQINQLVYAQSVNVIANPSVETVSPNDATKPASWTNRKWGTNTTTFTYPVAGYTSAKAMRIAMTSHTDGDAKWLHDEVTVKPNTTYTFSHAYQSTALSSIDIKYTLANGSVTYASLAHNVPASPTWKIDSFTFTPPANAKSMTVIHLIESVGTLTTDAYSLTTNQVVSNDTTKPTVSITSPTNNETVTGNKVFQIQANDNVAVAQVQLYIDGQPYGSSLSSAPYTVTVPTNSLSNGTHTVFAIAKDSSSNSATSGTISFTVNNSGVQPPITPPTTPPNVSGNLIPNASFEQKTTGGEVLPVEWTQSSWGVNTKKFTYPVAGATGNSAARVELTARTSGDSKWVTSSITNITGKRLRYSQKYRTNVPTYVSVEYTHSDGTNSYTDVGILIEPSTTWKTFEVDFEVPQDVVALRMLPILNRVGWLEIDDVTLVERPRILMNTGTITLAFDDGFKSVYQKAIPILNAKGIKSSQYVVSDYLNDTSGFYISKQEMLAMQAAGHEIASHTRTHAHLTQITQAQALDEIVNSRNNLLAQGATPVATFTYPYGEYNDSIKQIVKNAGYIGARSVNTGFNNKDTDRYALFDQHIENHTKLSSVKQWIDQANANKTWLVLEFHQQEIDCGTKQYCNTQAMLQDIVNYIVQSGIKVVTMKEGIDLLNAK